MKQYTSMCEQHRRGNGPSDETTRKDYTILTNEELQRLLHTVRPGMIFYITDDVRETAIAMLTIFAEDQSEAPQRKRHFRD